MNGGLWASTDGTGEYTPEGVATPLVGSGYQLGDVQDQRSQWVTVTDVNSGLIARGALIGGLGTVVLGGNWRGKVGNHLYERVTGGKQPSHDHCQEDHSPKFLLLGGKFGIEHTKDASLVAHDGIKCLENRVQTEGVEGTAESLATS